MAGAGTRGFSHVALVSISSTALELRVCASKASEPAQLGAWCSRQKSSVSADAISAELGVHMCSGIEVCCLQWMRHTDIIHLRTIVCHGQDVAWCLYLGPLLCWRAMAHCPGRAKSDNPECLASQHGR